MTEHTNFLDHNLLPDYELDDVLVLTQPEQFKAVVGDVRPRILGLLSQRAASISQIAAALGTSKGTTGHHVKVLEAAGLIRVVRTQQVRALTEKYYGRVARLFQIKAEECVPGVSGGDVPHEVMVAPLRQAAAEFAPAAQDDPSEFMISHAQIGAARAHEFALRLEALLREFEAHAEPGQPIFGFVAGIYRTNRPTGDPLPEP